MILEILFISLVFFAVLIVFYRQAIEQYNILQIENTQVSEIPKLLNERTPLVIREIGQPKLFTPESLKTNARLKKFPLGNEATLGSYIDNPSSKITLTKKASILLAKESGLSVWGEHTWYPKLFSYPFLQHIHSFSAEAQVGEQGLRKTTGIATLLYPTSGSLEITLLTEQQEKYLPQGWRGKYPEMFTIQDTPLVGEIKYITIKLRPGHMLAIPTHWFYSIRGEKNKPSLWCRFTLHNPVSLLASSMETTLDA
jgi:hypothetical protein